MMNRCLFPAPGTTPGEVHVVLADRLDGRRSDCGTLASFVAAGSDFRSKWLQGDGVSAP